MSNDNSKAQSFDRHQIGYFIGNHFESFNKKYEIWIHNKTSSLNYGYGIVYALHCNISDAMTHWNILSIIYKSSDLVIGIG